MLRGLSLPLLVCLFLAACSPAAPPRDPVDLPPGDSARGAELFD